jgi:NADPH-dependent 2,4-dienoyl-CoA reductase/sulfur reductase-like enzyme
MTYVIIGNGPAAIAAATEIRCLDAEGEIVLISKEMVPYYSPCPLAEYVENSIPRDHLFLKDAHFYTEQRITTHLGYAVTAVDTRALQVTATDGTRTLQVSFDRLLIAAGARAVMPPIPGLSDGTGVHALKTIGDADHIVALLPMVQRAVVIGSGFIGLEAAQALVRRGLTVTVIEAQGQVLPQMLDVEMAMLAESRLRRFGIDVRTGHPADAVLRDDAGNVTAVRAGGVDIACDLVICAAGVRPDLSMLADSGIATGRGILVDAYMETNVDGVFAAGDIVEALDYRGQRGVLPIWPNAVNGGKVAGNNMVKPRCSQFRGLENINVLRLFDLPVASFGDQAGEYTIRHSDNGNLKKLSIQKGKVIGGQFFGDVSAVGLYQEMMKKCVNIAAYEDQLLTPRFGYGCMLPRPLPVRSRA